MTKLRFEHRVAVVTGAADGIGRAVAERIAEEGGKVVLWDIQESLLQKRQEELQAAKRDCMIQVVDVSDEEQVKKAFAEAADFFGRIDILVHAAGIVGPTQTKITDYATEAFDQIYKINLRGSFLVCKHVIPHMEKIDYGRILLIASIAGKEGNPFMAGYSATKAGVIGLVKSLGKELAATGITVNGIAPAVIKTPMNSDTAPEQLEYMASKIPMQRFGTVAETASLAAWIVSEESSFNTAFVFDLSGGRATY
ncbi:MAG: SDR family oxidoreductase [Lunatimonas sp.]|uniref:SDR family NAD(P)-dependent oxidoreductase n=1 Tax=Lunatimonas sp. TaxID=2060141 RepID=UPI00263B7D44|nr:SDR family NAD(P)-dependent oxidoreductase [Lunatimonas sp.]MCC5936095.1 SDR family oxidoreductase [Lunatimonas sp.]